MLICIICDGICTEHSFSLILWQNNAQLSRRLLAGELEPIKILKMSSVELKV